jgi:hypothetical protein
MTYDHNIAGIEKTENSKNITSYQNPNLIKPCGVG